MRGPPRKHVGRFSGPGDDFDGVREVVAVNGDRDRLLSPEEWLVDRWSRKGRWFELSNARRPVPATPPAEPAAAVQAAWLPVRTGQAVPLQGEDATGRVCTHDGGSCDCR